MNKEESIMDDETLFFAYHQAMLADVIEFGNDECARFADMAVKEHRKRFPRRKRAHE